MKMNITARGKLHLSEKTKGQLEKRLSRLDKYFSGDPTAFLVLSEVKEKVRLEVTVKYRGLYFRGQKEAKDLLEALDRIIDLIERQIEKNKTRLDKKLRRGSIELPQGETEEEYEVVKVKQFAIKPMSVDEAILQMNMLGHNFFLFHDDKKDVACVVYRRDDGGYGLIESK